MPQGCPNGAQGYHNGAPRSLQIHKKPPKCSPRVTKWTPGCHNGAPRITKRRPKVTQSAKKASQGLPKAEIKKKILAFVCMLSVPVQPRFIGYRLCRRPLGPEEWMLGCLDARMPVKWAIGRRERPFQGQAWGGGSSSAA